MQIRAFSRRTVDDADFLRGGKARGERERARRRKKATHNGQGLLFG